MVGEIIKKFSSGLIKATVWKNKTHDGGEFKTVSLNKSYQKNGEWKNANSYSTKDLDKAIQVLQEARNFLIE